MSGLKELNGEYARGKKNAPGSERVPGGLRTLATVPGAMFWSGQVATSVRTARKNLLYLHWATPRPCDVAAMRLS
jgi:hypothetical protein